MVKASSSNINCLAALPDGYLAIGYSDSSVRIINPSTGEEIKKFKGNKSISSGVNCLAVRSVGALDCGSGNHTKVWLDKFNISKNLIDNNSTESIVFLPDNLLVCGSNDCVISIRKREDTKTTKITNR